MQPADFAPPATSQAEPARLAQLLAPIALYPDPLLAQIMMAATYPLEVVEASRWLQDPDNARLAGDALNAALENQTWDPSVKSLIPFPQIVRMMDSKLAWTEQLGDAFLVDQPALMDAVQQLRRQAMAANTLQSTPQQTVSSNDSVITIAAPSPSVVYVPVYDPRYVYGAWPYADFPPYYFPGFFGAVSFNFFGFGWLAIGIDLPLWGWSRWDWNHHGLQVGRGRLPDGVPWRHDPAHRHGVPYADAGTRSRFAAPETGARPAWRGYPAAAAGPAARAPESDKRADSAPARRAWSPPPSFESFGPARAVDAQAARGRASRLSGGMRTNGASRAPDGGARRK